MYQKLNYLLFSLDFSQSVSFIYAQHPVAQIQGKKSIKFKFQNLVTQKNGPYKFVQINQLKLWGERRQLENMLKLYIETSVFIKGCIFFLKLTANINLMHNIKIAPKSELISITIGLPYTLKNK